MNLYQIIRIDKTSNSQTVVETGLTLIEANRRIRELKETTNIYYMAVSGSLPKRND